MKAVDPTIELVACGSSGHGMPTSATGSPTCSSGPGTSSTTSRCTRILRGVRRRSPQLPGRGRGDGRVHRRRGGDHRRGRRPQRSHKRMRISFDEWNVWYLTRHMAQPLQEIDEAGPHARGHLQPAGRGRRGDLLISLLNHADRIGVACLAQLVNVIAPIRTEPGGTAWRQTTFHPFAAVALRARPQPGHPGPSARDRHRPLRRCPGARRRRDPRSGDGPGCVVRDQPFARPGDRHRDGCAPPGRAGADGRSQRAASAAGRAHRRRDAVHRPGRVLDRAEQLIHIR